MEPKGSSPYKQELITGLYTETVKSSSHSRVLFDWEYFPFSKIKENKYRTHEIKNVELYRLNTIHSVHVTTAETL
jgi:hypothetical protein